MRSNRQMDSASLRVRGFIGGVDSGLRPPADLHDPTDLCTGSSVCYGWLVMASASLALDVGRIPSAWRSYRCLGSQITFAVEK